MRVGLPLMKNNLIPLAKGALMPLGLMAAASTTDQLFKKTYGEGMATQKRWILGMLMASLDASLFGYLSSSKARISRQGVIRTGKRASLETTS